MPQQQQQQSQYYDKLLHHLNRTFSMNMKSQDLFLDLSRHKKTIHFKSIKNIYHTLTEGKADEVIYKKDKPQLINNHVFNSKFTQRTCWRMVEKMVTKVAYFLSNERGLGSIAPSIVKVIALLRNASEKVNNRASFVQFFEEVIDCIIAENNILEEKIYDLLIQRGYICSIDEFYRLNRFEGSNDDYNCPDEPSSDKTDKDSTLGVAGRSIETSSIRKSKRKNSRFLGVSSRRFGFQAGSKARHAFQEQSIPEETIQVQQNSEESELLEQQPKQEEFNRLSHNIHIQIEKTVEQLLNNNQFEEFMLTNKSQYHVSSRRESIQSKPSVVKELLKNIKNRNFKANQKILQLDGFESQRKNSSQKLMKKMHKRQLSNFQRNRTSIAMALNKGMKQRIFKNEHLADLQDLMVNNLNRLEYGDEYKENMLNKKNILFRAKSRQQTMILHGGLGEGGIKQLRRASNFAFLNNAFNFQGNSLPKNNFHDMKRMSSFVPECNMSQISSKITIESVSNQDRQQLIDRYVYSSNSRGGKTSNSKNDKFNMTKHGKMLSKLDSTQPKSRFASESKQFMQKKKYQNRFFNHNKVKSQGFNPTLLKITAQKYNKCITEQQEQFNNLELQQLNVFSSIKQLVEAQTQKSLKSLTSKKQVKQQFRQYQHHKKYDIYDRNLRRIL